MGLFAKSTPEEKAAKRAARQEQAERTLFISATKRVEFVEDALVIYEGLSETRLPVSKIESVSVRLHTITVNTAQRTYDFEASRTLTSRKQLDAWVARLQDAIA